LDIRVLEYFLAVAREGSITGAAESLHMTQPPLSRELMNLEEELGKKLLIRGSRRTTLTDDGIMLKKRAEEILELVEKSKAEISNSDKNIKGDVYIGSGETDAMRIVAAAARELQSANPGIRYQVFSGNAEDVLEKLDKGLLDFCVLLGNANYEKYDHFRFPVNDTWGILMRKGCDLSKKDFICADDLQNIPIIMPKQAMEHHEIFEWFGKSSEALNIVATYNLIFNATLMVDQGMGFALCLDKIANTSSESSLCFRPLYPSLYADIKIVRKKYHTLSKASEAFFNKLKVICDNQV
jgi:DNA-binding transcriptional LysR family regulator